MKLVFAHDHFFYKYKNQYYSNGSFSSEVLERYTSIFEEVIVLSRQKHIEKLNDKLTLASTERVKFVEIPNFKTISNISRTFKAQRIIENEIRNCDSLIARLPSSIGSLAVSLVEKYNKPYLVEVVACPWDAYWNHSLKGKIIAPFSYLKTKKLIWNARYTVYVTNNFLQIRYPTKGKAVSCSNVALKEFDESILNSRLEKIEAEKEEKIIIGTTASIDVRYKGQKYIIEALGKLKEQGNLKFEYQLVGGGDPTYLRSLAEKYGVTEQVKFLGSLPHNKVFKWLDTIDIYTQPSRQEGLPRALIEAMSRGLPAFGANTAGIPELLDSPFIFSNTKKNSQEICSIIQYFTKDQMIRQAKRNYEEAKKYKREIIENRRSLFFGEFKNENKGFNS